MGNNDTERAVELWLQALQSGAFPQDTQQLRSDDGFCCLGVACEVYRQATGRGRWEDQGSFGYDFIVKDKGMSHRVSTTLPYSVMAWLGLNSCGASFAFHDSLIRANDNLVPFPEIARIIRSSPAGLFKEQSP